LQNRTRQKISTALATPRTSKIKIHSALPLWQKFKW
jgi:hypothetical protein